MKKKYQILIIFIIVVCFIALNYFIKIRNYNTYGDYSSSSEYLVTEDLFDVLSSMGAGEYSISFEARSDINGVVAISLYETDGSAFWFSTQKIDSTTEFKEYTIHVNISKTESDYQHSHLTFHGTYGTGVIPHVRNINIVKE